MADTSNEQGSSSHGMYDKCVSRGGDYVEMLGTAVHYSAL
jgi:hypothetical protein